MRRVRPKKIQRKDINCFNVIIGKCYNVPI